MKLAGIVVMMLTVFTPVPVLASGEQATVYAKADTYNLMRAMLRAIALDASDPLVRDDYLLMYECDLYRANFRDEFQMRRLQEGAAKAIAQNRPGWPNAFTFKTPLLFDHYDFKAEQYLLKDNSKLQNVNSFVLLPTSETAVCLQDRRLRKFPSSVAVRIDQPVSITGIPLPQKQAEALLQRLTAGGTKDEKTIYARFSIAVSFMPPIEQMLKTGEVKLGRYTFDGRLMQVEFFEDEAFTKPIWTLTR